MGDGPLDAHFSTKRIANSGQIVTDPDRKYLKVADRIVLRNHAAGKQKHARSDAGVLLI